MTEPTDWGWTLLRHVEHQLDRADARAQATLMLEALLLIGIFVTAPADGRWLIWFLTLLAAAALLVALVLCLTVLMPKVNPPGRLNFFYFSSILTLREEDLPVRLRELTPADLETMLFSELYALSAITQRKFLRIRRSYQALFLGLGLWILTLLRFLR